MKKKKDLTVISFEKLSFLEDPNIPKLFFILIFFQL